MQSKSNISILYIESAKTVNEMTLNELVKLTMLRTTGPYLTSPLKTINSSSKWMETISWYQKDAKLSRKLMMMICGFTSLSTLFSSYRENGRAIMKGFVKWSIVQSWILPAAGLQPWNLLSAVPNQISFISMHVQSLVKTPWHLLKISSEKWKYGHLGQTTVKIWRNLPISNPKPDLQISMHIPSLVKIHWCLLKLSSGNEKRTDIRLTDRQIEVQHETIITHHYCEAGYKNW